MENGQSVGLLSLLLPQEAMDIRCLAGEAWPKSQTFGGTSLVLGVFNMVQLIPKKWWSKARYPSYQKENRWQMDDYSTYDMDFSISSPF